MSSPDNEWHMYKHKRNNANVELRYFCCLIFLRLLLSTFSFKFFILPWTHLSIFILLRNFLSEIAFLVNTYCLLYTVQLLTMKNSQDSFRPKTEISFLLHHFQRNMVRKVFNSNVSAITGAYRPDFLLHLFQSTFKEERRKKNFYFNSHFFHVLMIVIKKPVIYLYVLYFFLRVSIFTYTFMKQRRKYMADTRCSEKLNLEWVHFKWGKISFEIIAWKNIDTLEVLDKGKPAYCQLELQQSRKVL